ncbi:hypothetical protein LS482_18855 [Sinomicrobium kalidii]|uniref:hypothetical protein n=1 Tax=Sinomicrobium kalidii TaxID=2900738 RepID=UPI001E5F1666|nr:hypothetical protein [Sinomicrobium kalidii]UGU15728.1 hypothetical protein LS482_18855 [Sinomicrobium kalidii]
MKHFYTTIFCLSVFALQAQEKTLEFTVDHNSGIRDYDVTGNGSFFILENVRSPHRTRMTLLDENLDEVYTFRGREQVTGDEVMAVSRTGKNSVFQQRGMLQSGEYYHLNQNKLSRFPEIRDAAGEGTGFYFDGHAHAVKDRVQFLNDEYLVAVQKRDEGYPGTAYLHLKSLSGGNEDRIILNIPGKAEFKSPDLLYFDNTLFVVALVKEAAEASREYLCLTYDYRGRLVNSTKFDFEVNDPEKEKFAPLHLNRDSFSSYKHTAPEYPYKTRTALAGQFATEDAGGAVVYDPSEKAYYAYAGVRPQDGDSGVLIAKYDGEGKAVWKKYSEVPGAVFRNTNGFDRYLTLDVTPHFLGVSVYSARGKDFCRFYILEKEDGHMINSKTFNNYRLRPYNTRFAGLYSRFSSGEKGYKNIVFDRFTVFSSLYDSSFSAFINNIGTETLLKSYPTASGTNVVSVKKKARKLTFQKFVF